MKKYIIFMITVIFSFTLLNVYSKEDEDSTPIAKLKLVKGTVFVQKFETEKKISAKQDMKLYPEDMIITEKDGECTILYKNESLLKVSPESQIKINEVVDEEEDSNSIICFIGQIIAKIKKGSNQKFEVMTPTAVVGVRGTEFMVATGEDGASLVGVMDGTVEVENENEKKIKIGKGEKVEIEYNAKMRKGKGFQYNKFNRREWMRKRREFFIKHKDKILKYIDKRFNRFEKTYNLIEKRINRLEQQRARILKDMRIARERSDQKQLMKLRNQLRKNYIQFVRTTRGLRKLNSRFIGNVRILKRFNRIPQFKKFEERYAARFKRIRNIQQKLHKNIRKDYLKRRKILKEYRKHLIKRKYRKERMKHPKPKLKERKEKGMMPPRKGRGRARGRRR